MLLLFHHSWGCYLTAELSCKIDAFLMRELRYWFAANIQTVSAHDLFYKTVTSALLRPYLTRGKEPQSLFAHGNTSSSFSMCF